MSEQEKRPLASLPQSPADRDWLVLRYVLNELDAQQAAEFESQLSGDPDLCDLVAENTLLLDNLQLAVAGNRGVRPSGSSQPHRPRAVPAPAVNWQASRPAVPVAPRATAASLLLMVCGVLGLSLWIVGTGSGVADRSVSDRQGTRDRGLAASPANVLQHGTGLSAAGADLLTRELVAGNALLADAPETDALNALNSTEDAEPALVHVPDWLLAAVQFSLDPSLGNELPLERTGEGEAL